jgi:aerotaxis receptor
LDSELSDTSAIKTQLMAGQVALQIFLFFFIGYCVNRLIRVPLAVVESEFSNIMQGNLDNELDISIQDEMGDLLCKTQTMNAYLRTMVDEVVNSGNAMQEQIREVDSRIAGVAANALIEQDHVQKIAQAMDEFSASAAEVSSMAADSMADAQAMQGTVEENSRNMELSINASNKVAETVQSSSRTIADLGASIQKIGAIANAIKEIADQTNLLALNAAIEAARAGEQGRGFAVVADEVRKLAERTASSTKDIASTIGEISAISGAAVQTMQGAVTEVEAGITLIRKNGEGLKEIMSAAVSVAGRIEHIATAAKEQSVAGHEMAGSLVNVAALVDSNAHAAEATKELADNLTLSAAELKKAGYPLTKCAAG